MLIGWRRPTVPHWSRIIAADVRAMTAESDSDRQAFRRDDMTWPPTTFALCCTSWWPRRRVSPLTAGELRTRMGMSGAAITYLVERMIASGHFRRESDPSDRRKVILRVADDGIDRRPRLFHAAGRAQPARDGGVARRRPRRRAPNVHRDHRRDAGISLRARPVVTSSMSRSAATVAPSVRILPAMSAARATGLGGQR